MIFSVVQSAFRMGSGALLFGLCRVWWLYSGPFSPALFRDVWSVYIVMAWLVFLSMRR